MEPTQQHEPRLPSWVTRLDTPVWIRDPEGNISYFNPQAEALFGRARAEVMGLPCHRAIEGIRGGGQAFCRRNCAIAQQAVAGEALPPVRFRVGRDSGARWLRCLFIPIWDGERGPWIVHCALDDDRAQRITAYLEGVAEGRQPAGNQRRAADARALTRREEEVLRHLAAGEELPVVADRLFISYATVRNHVQHILGKLGAHSIQQAVAWYLLHRE